MSFSIFGSTTKFTASTTIDSDATLIKNFKDKNNNPVYQIKDKTWSTNGNKYVWCKPLTINTSMFYDSAINSVKLFRTSTSLYGANAGNNIEITNGEFFYGDVIDIRFYIKDGYRLDNETNYVTKTITLDSDVVVDSIGYKPYTKKEILLTIRLDNADAMNITEITSTTGIETISERVTVTAANSDSGKEEHLYKYWLTIGSGGSAQYTIKGIPRAGYAISSSNISLNASSTATAPVTKYRFYYLKRYNVGVTAGTFWNKRNNSNTALWPYYNMPNQTFSYFPTVKIYVQRNSTNYPKTGFESSTSDAWTSNTTAFNSSSSSTTNYSTTISSPTYKYVYHGDYVSAYGRSDSFNFTVNNSTYPSSTSPMIDENKTLILNVDSITTTTPSSTSGTKTLTFNQNTTYGSSGQIDLRALMQSNTPSWQSYALKTIAITDTYSYSNYTNDEGGDTQAIYAAQDLQYTFTGSRTVNSTSSPVAISSKTVTLKLNTLSSTAWASGQDIMRGNQWYNDESSGGDDYTFHVSLAGSRTAPKLQNKVVHTWYRNGDYNSYSETLYGTNTYYKFNVTITYEGQNASSSSTTYVGTYQWSTTPTVSPSSRVYQNGTNTVYLNIIIDNGSDIYETINNNIFKILYGRSSQSINNLNVIYDDGNATVINGYMDSSSGWIDTVIRLNYPGIPTSVFEFSSLGTYYPPAGGK